MKLYSIFELLNAYKENKHLIDAYYKNKSIEGYSNNTKNVGNFDPNDFPNIDPNNFPPINPNNVINNAFSILGMGIRMFIAYLAIQFIIFVVCLVLITQLDLGIKSTALNFLSKLGLVSIGCYPIFSIILLVFLIIEINKQKKVTPAV